MEESRIVCCLKFLQTEELELPFLREKGADFTMDQTISKTESAILHTYNRYDLVLEKETALTCMIQMEKPIWILARGLVSVLLDMETKHCSLH